MARLLTCVCCLLHVTTSDAIEYTGFFADVRPVGGLEGDGLDFPSDVSDDGLAVYLNSDRLGEGPPEFAQRNDLFVASKKLPDEPFGSPTKIEEISRNGFEEGGQIVTDEGLTTYFHANWPHDNRAGRYSIWTSTRDVDDSWGEPEVLEVDTDRAIAQPRLSSDGSTLYLQSNNGPGTQLDLFQSRLSRDGSFGPLEPLAELNTPTMSERNQSLSSDGLAIFYSTHAHPITDFSDILVAMRDSTNEPFRDPVNLNDFSLGSEVNQMHAYTATPVISPRWPEHGSKLYFSAADGFEDFDVYEATWFVIPPGDLNLDSKVTVSDIDLLNLAIRDMLTDVTFDLNDDGLVDAADRITWVHDIAVTSFGDSNLDGQFNRVDLVEVLQAGEFADTIAATPHGQPVIGMATGILTAMI